MSPAPARGAAVVETGTVTATSGATSTVTVAGQSYTLPHVGAPTVGGTHHVLWAGRTGVVLAAPDLESWWCDWVDVDHDTPSGNNVAPTFVGSSPYVNAADDSYIRNMVDFDTGQRVVNSYAKLPTGFNVYDLAMAYPFTPPPWSPDSGTGPDGWYRLYWRVRFRYTYPAATDPNPLDRTLLRFGYAYDNGDGTWSTPSPAGFFNEVWDGSSQGQWLTRYGAVAASASTMATLQQKSDQGLLWFQVSSPPELSVSTATVDVDHVCLYWPGGT